LFPLRHLDEFLFYRMKTIQKKQQGLRTRLRNNQREIQRLMKDYENFGAVRVTGHNISDMDDWLVGKRPKRQAPAVHSPDPLEQTQTTDMSTQPTQSTMGESNISDAASEALAAPFSDDYTGTSDDDEDEQRSVDTATGLPDTQASDSPFLSRSERKKRRSKKSKKDLKKKRKAAKKRSGRKDNKKERSPPASPSY
jgi:hypothetical protein